MLAVINVEFWCGDYCSADLLDLVSNDIIFHGDSGEILLSITSRT